MTQSFAVRGESGVGGDRADLCLWSVWASFLPVSPRLCPVSVPRLCECPWRASPCPSTSAPSAEPGAALVPADTTLPGWMVQGARLCRSISPLLSSLGLRGYRLLILGHTARATVPGGARQRQDANVPTAGTGLSPQPGPHPPAGPRVVSRSVPFDDPILQMRRLSLRAVGRLVKGPDSHVSLQDVALDHETAPPPSSRPRPGQAGRPSPRPGPVSRAERSAV